MASRLRRTALAPVLALMLSGCVSAYVRPDLNLPDRFAHAPATEVAAAGDDRWWRAVNDPVLDAVVDQVLSRNRDLALATLTLRRARLTAGLVRQDQWPTAAGNLTASRSGPVSSYTANLSVGYDLDLWRGLAAASSAAQWAASATAQDREATRIGLVATTCQLYWDIVFTRQQLTTGDANLVAQRRLLDLVTAQRTYGALSTVEVAEADLAVETQATAQSVLAQHLVEDLAALAILAGNGPALVATDAGDLNAMAPPEVPAGLPLALVGRRPDVRAAEMRLRGALATVDAAHAAVFPDLTLTAGGGAASSALSALLDHPVGTLTAAISAPFLDFSRLRFRSWIAETDRATAELAFKSAVYRALSDVDNALSARTELTGQRLSLARSLTSAQTAERLLGVRYRAGSVALDILLDAQQRRRAAQTALDANTLARLDNFAVLAQALGGPFGP